MEEIEVLDDGLEEKIAEPVKEEVPLFFAETNEIPQTNVIEEVKDPSFEEKIIDPVSSIITLDPNYEKMVEEENGTDLKSAINDLRNITETLRNKGFNIDIEELDLDENYQINIKIKK